VPTFTRRSGLLLAILLLGWSKIKVLRRPSAHCELGFRHLALDDVDETENPRLSPCCTAHGWYGGCRFSGTVTPRSWRAGWVMGRAVVGKVLSFLSYRCLLDRNTSAKSLTWNTTSMQPFAQCVFIPTPTPFIHQYLYAVVSVSPSVSLGFRSCWTSVK